MQLCSTLQILLVQTNGKILIPFAHASEIAGIPEQTARNRLSNGDFPIPTVLNGSRRFIHVSDLANFIESLRSPPPKKLGRPNKADQFVGGVK